MSKSDYIAILGIFILIGFIIIFCQYIYEEREELNTQVNLIIPKIAAQKIDVIEITATAYSPSSHITDSNPFETASQLIVTPQDLEQMKYVALSRDLIEEYGMEYGDVIYIGFEVQDTMNKRIENTVDLFLRNLDLARKFGRQTREIIILEEE